MGIELSNRHGFGWALCTLVLAGCGVIASPEPVRADAHEASGPAEELRPIIPTPMDVPDGGDTADSANSASAMLYFELLRAELALRSGDMQAATEAYLRASVESVDARVAERATQLALYHRRWGDAEQAARRWLELDPNSEDARALIAEIQLQGERGAELADESFIELIEQSEDRGSMLRSIYALLLQERSQEDALSSLQQLRDAFGEEIEAHLGVARTALMLGETELAGEAVDDALALRPDSSDALVLKAQLAMQSGHTDEAVAALRSAMETQPDNQSLRLGLARILAEEGSAEAELAQELELIYGASGENAELLLNIGLLAIDAGLEKPAERYLRRLLALGEDDARAHYYLARLAERQGRPHSAITHYDAVPDGELRLDAQLRSAELMAGVGKTDEALQRLGQLRPPSPPAELDVELMSSEARILETAEREDEALSVLDEAIELYPDQSRLLYQRALLRERNGDELAMIADLEALIASEPDNAHALNALGYHYADRNRELETANELLERAMGLRPDDPAIMDSLGWLRFRQGALEESERLLRTAYKRFPDGEIAAHLGEVLWTQGKSEDAQAIWSAALERDPEHEKILETRERLSR